MSLNPVDPDDPEPYPWLRSRNRGSVVYALPGLRHPLGSLIYGCAFIALGAGAALYGLALSGAGRVALLAIALIPAALGARMVYLGARRWGWYYRFRQRHGYPPL